MAEAGGRSSQVGRRWVHANVHEGRDHALAQDPWVVRKGLEIGVG